MKKDAGVMPMAPLAQARRNTDMNPPGQAKHPQDGQLHGEPLVTTALEVMMSPPFVVT